MTNFSFLTKSFNTELWQEFSNMKLYISTLDIYIATDFRNNTSCIAHTYIHVQCNQAFSQLTGQFSSWVVRHTPCDTTHPAVSNGRRQNRGWGHHVTTHPHSSTTAHPYPTATTGKTSWLQANRQTHIHCTYTQLDTGTWLFTPEQIYWGHILNQHNITFLKA